MATIVFVCLPAHGHVNPTLAVARELVARGEKVIYYLPESFRATVEATGATFRGYQVDTQAGWSGSPVVPRSGEAFFGFLSGTLKMSQRLLPQALEWLRMYAADCLVYERFCFWGEIAARNLSLPSVLFTPSFLMGARNVPQPRAQMFFEKIAAIGDELRQLGESYGVPMDLQTVFSQPAPLNLIFQPRAFYPADQPFDKGLLFVGSSVAPRHDPSGFPLQQLEGRQVLYISLGTVFNDRADFFRLCFEAFKDQPWLVVLSHGNRVKLEDLAPIPSNFLIAASVPQLEVLARAQVFVTHSGMNSAMESLYYGVPMVAVPQMMEQEATAERLQALELGIVLDPERLSVEDLRSAVKRVAEESSFHEHAREMQRLIHEAGGAKRAADAIIQFSREHGAEPA